MIISSIVKRLFGFGKPGPKRELQTPDSAKYERVICRSVCVACRRNDHQNCARIWNFSTVRKFTYVCTCGCEKRKTEGVNG